MVRFVMLRVSVSWTVYGFASALRKALSLPVGMTVGLQFPATPQSPPPGLFQV